MVGQLLPSPNTEQIFSPELTPFLSCPSLKDFCMVATPASFLFFLFWPVSYLAALTVKYSLVKLEFSQMPSYLKWLGEYSDRSILTRRMCYLRVAVYERPWQSSKVKFQLEFCEETSFVLLVYDQVWGFLICLNSFALKSFK